MENREIDWLLAEKYQGLATEAFNADCARLLRGEPLGYVIGHAPFLNCVIGLDSRPLIPRTETEFWVERAIQIIKQAAKEYKHQLRILDLCAGSGAIGIAIAQAIESVDITFGEIEPTHQATIKKNCLLNNLNVDRVHIIESDLFAQIDSTFDFILTNPPYIDPRIDRTERSVKNFEPHLALYGGKSGLDIITRIIMQATEHLTLGGQLWIEHEPEQVAAIARLASPRYTMVTHPDQYQFPRFSILTMAQ